MRKVAILSLSTCVLAFGALVMPTSESQAYIHHKAACGAKHHHSYPSYNSFGSFSFISWGYHMKHVTPCPPTRDSKIGGQIAVGCGLAAASSAMIVAAIKGNDKTDPRQATIFEAGWSVSACPVFLPWSILVSAMCQDNKATYEIARQAYRLNARAGGSIDNTPFTNAYYQACREGTLSKDFLVFLKANNLPLSSYYLSAKSKPVLKARG
jgi:hypothetical protein